MPQEDGSARYADMQLRKRRGGGFNVANAMESGDAYANNSPDITLQEVVFLFQAHFSKHKLSVCNN
jgi:hypothetical protein